MSAQVFKVERFKRDEQERKIPKMKSGRPELVTRGRHKGEQAYEKEPYLDAKGRPRWRARVYEPQAGKYLVKTFVSQKDARRWVHEKEGRKSGRQALRGDRRTVGEYMAWWLGAKADGGVHGRRGKQLQAPRARTMTDYRKTVRRWIETPPDGMPPLGSVRLDDLTHGHLDDFYAAMRSRTTAGIIRRLHALLTQAFAEAWRKEFLPFNPCDKASVPGKRKEVEGDDEASSKSLTEEQAKRFLAAARETERNGPYSALWHLLTMAGLRPSEAFALDWKDVLGLDGPEPKVRVRRTLARKRRTDEQREQNKAAGWRFEPPKTTNGHREVPLPALSAQELRAWRLRQKWQRRVAGDEWTEHGFVFTSGKGTPLGGGKGCHRSFVCVMARTNGDEGTDGELGTWGAEPKRERLTGPLRKRRFTPSFRIYDLRHTCITLWLRTGVPAQVASKLAGHATVAFTLGVYAKALPSQKQEAAAMMDRMFGTG